MRINMRINPKKLPTLLAYLGAIPFIAGSLLLSFGVYNVPVLGGTAEMLRSYSFAIAVFMCGVHWGQYLQDPQARHFNLLMLSNGITVLLWIAYLMISFFVFSAMVIVAFMILLWIDYRLYESKSITWRYFRMRLTVTAVVCLSLALPFILF
jgi:hypothetical protein